MCLVCQSLSWFMLVVLMCLLITLLPLSSVSIWLTNCWVTLSIRHCSQYQLSAFHRPSHHLRTVVPHCHSRNKTSQILKNAYFCLKITTWLRAHLLSGLRENLQSSIPTHKLNTLHISYTAHNSPSSSFPCLMGGEHLSRPIECKRLWGQIYFFILHSIWTCALHIAISAAKEVIPPPGNSQLLYSTVSSQDISTRAGLRAQEAAGALSMQEARQPHRCSCHLRLAGSRAHSHNDMGSVFTINWGILLHQQEGLRIEGGNVCIHKAGDPRTFWDGCWFSPKLSLTSGWEYRVRLKISFPREEDVFPHHQSQASKELTVFKVKDHLFSFL